MENLNIPKQLKLNGHLLSAAGSGRQRGSYAFVDHVKGQIIELFLGRVVQTGAHFSKLVVPSLTQLGELTLQHGVLEPGAQPAVGQACLVRLTYGDKPRVAGAWFLRRPTHRETGRVFETSLRHYGYIIPDGGGERIFVHGSEMSNPNLLTVGQRVSYERHRNSKGWIAKNVWPSN